VTQRAIQQMLAQNSGGSIINVSTSMAEHPIAGIPSAVPMITKGGLEAVTRSLAIEYAKQGIRVNAVAPGVVDTPMHESDNKDFMKSLSPMGRLVSIGEVVDAIVYLSEAATVTGEILHVDGGSHAGKW
jgi:NAD(P)-dependent dehydrogenase (short-subunit alcohol dehydrogenase family)